MEIALDPDLETALTELARLQGIAPEDLVVKLLRERLPHPVPRRVSHDEFVRRLRSMGRDCGVSLLDSALSRDELYD